MTLPFSGGCACGAVRYECTGEPILAMNCHCRDCQRASGSAYASALFVAAESFRITHGELRYHVVTRGDDNRVGRGFCAACGCPVAATQSAYPIAIVYAASLDDPSGHRPTLDIFAASAQPWDHLDPGLPKFARGVGSPPL